MGEITIEKRERERWMGDAVPCERRRDGQVDGAWWSDFRIGPSIWGLLYGLKLGFDESLGTEVLSQPGLKEEDGAHNVHNRS